MNPEVVTISPIIKRCPALRPPRRCSYQNDISFSVAKQRYFVCTTEIHETEAGIEIKNVYKSAGTFLQSGDLLHNTCFIGDVWAVERKRCFWSLMPWVVKVMRQGWTTDVLCACVHVRMWWWWCRMWWWPRWMWGCESVCVCGGVDSW